MPQGATEHRARKAEVGGVLGHDAWPGARCFFGPGVFCGVGKNMAKSHIIFHCVFLTLDKYCMSCLHGWRLLEMLMGLEVALSFCTSKVMIAPNP